MEERTLRAIIGKSGGNSSKNTLNYKMTIPNKWAQDMGITQEDRELKVTFKDNKIIVEKSWLLVTSKI